jgi:hypothetical protein
MFCCSFDHTGPTSGEVLLAWNLGKVQGVQHVSVTQVRKTPDAPLVNVYTLGGLAWDTKGGHFPEDGVLVKLHRLYSKIVLDNAVWQYERNCRRRSKE